MIPWWVHVLSAVSARKTMTPGPRPVLVYGDAAGCGHLGSVVLVDGVALVSRTHVPEWMVLAKSGIFELELAASLVKIGKERVIYHA